MAIKAVAAALEMPNDTANFVLAAVSSFFILTTVTSRKAESLFRVFMTCCSPIVTAMTLCTRVCIFIRSSFSEAKIPMTPVAVVNRPDKPFTPLITPCKAASSLARIFVWVRRSPMVSANTAALSAISAYSLVFCLPSKRRRAIASCISRSCIERRLVETDALSCSASREERMFLSSCRALVQASISARISSCAFPGARLSYCFFKSLRQDSTYLICSFWAAIRSVMLLDTCSALSPSVSADLPALSMPGESLSLIMNSISTGFIVLSIVIGKIRKGF